MHINSRKPKPGDNKDAIGGDINMRTINQLSPNHRHSGASTDGNKIPDRNIDFIYNTIYIPPAQFEQSTANIAYVLSSGFAVISFTDGAIGLTTANIFPPKHKRAISRIRILYRNLTVSGDLRFAFTLTRGRIGGPTVISSLSILTYTSAAVTGQINFIEVPKSLFPDVNQFKENDILAFEIGRDGSSPLDTYNANFEMLGLVVEFI